MTAYVKTTLQKIPCTMNIIFIVDKMWRHLFLRIVEALGNHLEHFQVTCDATGKHGLTPLTKFIAAMRMLAYGIAVDCVDEL